MPFKDKARAREWAAAYRARTREKEREKQRRWVEENRERRLEWERQHRRRPHVKEKRRLDGMKARALRHEAFVETVHRADVWTRDRGICGLCNLPADPEHWDLDHVIPLSCGGTHEYKNVQVSHPLCNQQKGGCK